jgi:hypothetical protein
MKPSLVRLNWNFEKSKEAIDSGHNASYTEIVQRSIKDGDGAF